VNNRYKQYRKARHIQRDCIDTSIPQYDERKNIWYIGSGPDRVEADYLDEIVQDFVGMQMKFRYHWDGKKITRRVFDKVLEDIVNRYESFSIEGFEEDYTEAQQVWLEKIRQRLLELKGRRKVKS